MDMVNLLTKSYVSKLIKMELCSDYFFSLLCWLGVLKGNNTGWLDGAIPPKYVITQSDNTFSGQVNCLVREYKLWT